MTLKLTYGKAFLVLTDYAERTHQLPFPERMKDLPKNFLDKAQNKKQENILKESLNIVIDHQKNKNSKDVIKDVRKKNNNSKALKKKTKRKAKTYIKDPKIYLRHRNQLLELVKKHDVKDIDRYCKKNNLDLRDCLNYLGLDTLYQEKVDAENSFYVVDKKTKELISIFPENSASTKYLNSSIFEHDLVLTYEEYKEIKKEGNG